MNSIDDVRLAGKRVLARVDFNVPLAGGEVTDDTRIRAALPTIRTIIEAGGVAILMSHLGRPKGEDPQYSLRPVATHLEHVLGRPVTFVPATVGVQAQEAVDAAKPGDVLLLENTRFLDGEKKNDAELARQLGALADVYVNDAFGSAHRAHASTEGVTHHVEVTAMGHLMRKELQYLGEALKEPARPFVAVLGGAKVSDKIGVIQALMGKVDHLLIGGAMSYTFLKSIGHLVGTSLVENDRLGDAHDMYEASKGRLVLPIDHKVARAFDNDAEQKTVTGDIPDGWMGLDIGPQSIEHYQSILKDAKTVVWNGPMGVFEMDNFAEGTRAIARTLAGITDQGATTIVGGGDSVAAITQAGLDDEVSHVSTGGGAMLEFLEGQSLPGVQALDA
ncbi:MAG: phosphoglycerate kinase [Bacteroidota bacterium]